MVSGKMSVPRMWYQIIAYWTLSICGGLVYTSRNNCGLLSDSNEEKIELVREINIEKIIWITYHSFAGKVLNADHNHIHIVIWGRLFYWGEIFGWSSPRVFVRFRYHRMYVTSMNNLFFLKPVYFSRMCMTVLSRFNITFVNIISVVSIVLR